MLLLLLLSDNVAAVAYINHLGGPIPGIAALASAAWITTCELGIKLSRKQLACKENVHADHLSRLSPHYEWQPHPRLFKFLDCIWGPHTIDRFASFINAHLPLYNTRYFDLGSDGVGSITSRCSGKWAHTHSDRTRETAEIEPTGGVDALAQLDWAYHNNFVNAPFRLIPRIPQLILEQQAGATLLVL